MYAVDFAVVGELGDALELGAAVEKLAPDLILLDISLPGITGLDAAERLLRERPEAKVIFLTAQHERSCIKRAFQIGGRGYVLKRSPSDLLTALRQVLRGNRYLSPFLGPLPEEGTPIF